MCYYVYDCCDIMFQSGRPKWSKCVHRHLHIRFPIFSQCLAQCDNMFLVGMSIYHLHKNVLPNSWFWMYKRILTFAILIPKMSVQGAIELYIRCIKVSKVLVLKVNIVNEVWKNYFEHKILVED